jgi:hypothetical protein
VLDEHVELLERAFVEQQFDPLARRQLAFGVLGFDPRVSYILSEVLDSRTTSLGKGMLSAISSRPSRIALASAELALAE